MTLAIVLEPVPIAIDPDGVVRVAKTRVTLDTVVTAFLEGFTSKKILADNLIHSNQEYPKGVSLINASVSMIGSVGI